MEGSNGSGGSSVDSGGGGDSDDATDNDVSVYLTPELNVRHVGFDRRKLHKQHRVTDCEDRGRLYQKNSTSISTDDDDCYFSTAEAVPPPPKIR